MSINQPVGSGVRIATDACPWGMGGILVCDGSIVAYFATPITDADRIKFDARSGESGFNTLWEALAILIAARLWLGGARDGQVEVRSDSRAALGALFKLASPGWRLNIIAREAALDQAEEKYNLDLLTHIPGVANVIPDALSRMWAPEPKSLPRECLEARRDDPPPRSPAFWRSAKPIGPPALRFFRSDLRSAE